jgi:4'-phosphopantetheinyl transferase
MVYCLLQYHSDLPPTLDWLSPIERERLEQLVIPKRRNDWLLGRWTARKLVEELFQSSHFAIVAAPDGAPELAWSEERCTRQFDISLSISHCHGWAFCGLSQVSGLRIGVDIERIESHSPAFIDQFFTDPERAEVERCDQNLWNGFGCVARAKLVQHNQNSFPTIFGHTHLFYSNSQKG